MVGHQGGSNTGSEATGRLKTEVDLGAHAILSRWCQTVNTELALQRLAVLERVALMLRAKLPANLRNSSQLLAHQLTTLTQDKARKRAQATRAVDEAPKCTLLPITHEPYGPLP